MVKRLICALRGHAVSFTVTAQVKVLTPVDYWNYDALLRPCERCNAWIATRDA